MIPYEELVEVLARWRARNGMGDAVRAASARAQTIPASAPPAPEPPPPRFVDVTTQPARAVAAPASTSMTHAEEPTAVHEAAADEDGGEPTGEIDLDDSVDLVAEDEA